MPFKFTDKATNNLSEKIVYKPIRKSDLISDDEFVSTENTKEALSIQVTYNEGAKHFEFKPQFKGLSSFDVGAYILSKLGSITTMKLHKLLYYCQAWSLVWDEQPLFEGEIEAWANGPVVRDLFAYHRGSYSLSSIPIGNKDLLSMSQKETVDSVLKFYGDKSAQWLIDLTHLEDPWKIARIGLSPNEPGKRVITHASMAEYYSSL